MHICYKTKHTNSFPFEGQDSYKLLTGLLVPVVLWEKPAMSGKNEWAAGVNLPSSQEDNLGVAQDQLHKLQICFVASESQFFLKCDIVHLIC